MQQFCCIFVSKDKTLNTIKEVLIFVMLGASTVGNVPIAKATYTSCGPYICDCTTGSSGGVTVRFPGGGATYIPGFSSCQIIAYGPPGGGGSPGVGGSGGALPPPPNESPRCRDLREVTPATATCPGPIAFPEGPTYGSNHQGAMSKIENLFLASGSFNIDTSILRFNGALTTALSNVTARHTSRGTLFSTSVVDMYTAVGLACHDYRQELQARYSGIGSTDLMQINLLNQCDLAMQAIGREASGHDYGIGYDVSTFWREGYGIDVDDTWIPDTLVNWFSTENSLRERLERVRDDATCSDWWREMEANQCL